MEVLLKNGKRFFVGEKLDFLDILNKEEGYDGRKLSKEEDLKEEVNEDIIWEIADQIYECTNEDSFDEVHSRIIKKQIWKLQK
ncbi:hypothetical protein A3715_19855 [Oleiphilus sp. HI0009]|nr:hypothetical protein A3715_19855 [Oleiphilus sp. HI0009]